MSSLIAKRMKALDDIEARKTSRKIRELASEIEALKQQVEQGKRDAVPEGWKLLKDSTQDERSWSEDFIYENGNYFNTCCRCDRTFMGHKRRPICKVCFAAAPKQEK